MNQMNRDWRNQTAEHDCNSTDIEAVNSHFFLIKKLGIKHYQLGSRIRDMKTEWKPKVITDLISW